MVHEPAHLQAGLGGRNTKWESIEMAVLSERLAEDNVERIDDTCRQC